MTRFGSTLRGGSTGGAATGPVDPAGFSGFGADSGCGAGSGCGVDSGSEPGVSSCCGVPPRSVFLRPAPYSRAARFGPSCDGPVVERHGSARSAFRSCSRQSRLWQEEQTATTVVDPQC